MPEPEPRLTEPDTLRGYLAALATRLPASVTDELADGLTETYRFHLSRGLESEAAAAAAVAEFGAAEEIAAGFAEVNPARRAARRLLRIGPVVGACWIAALLTSRAWTGWFASAPTWAATGVVLAGLIGLLAVAALGRRYRLATTTGAAGCFGFATLDAALIAAAIFALAPLSWVTALAIMASLTRIAVTAKALRPALIR
jgi:hypothetical protein